MTISLDLDCHMHWMLITLWLAQNVELQTLEQWGEALKLGEMTEMYNEYSSGIGNCTIGRHI